MTALVPGRPPVLAARGMVSASHPAISQAGARVLADGGNAVDATLAMAAMSWVVLPGQCGIGGDAFAVVRLPSGEVRAVSGSGYGPDGGSAAFYRERRLTAIPGDGALAVAVPGAIAAISVLARRATRPLTVLWSDAIGAAEAGVPVTAKTQADIRDHADALARDRGSAAILLPSRRVPPVGGLLAYPDLARTMRLAAGDPRQFYSGWLGEQMVSYLRGAGAPFTGDEWSAAAAIDEVAAISMPYGRHTIHQAPPPSPGWMVLQQAAICDGILAGLPWPGTDAVHWLAAAAQAAFADRFRCCGGDDDGWQDLLAPAAVGAHRARIRAGDLRVAGPGFSTGAGLADGDTTSMVAVDGDGMAVSFIHSLGFTFGARVTVPGTGVLLNNRLGRGAYLIEGHPNQVQPRRRPLSTLNAWIVTGPGGSLAHVGNTPGGDGQVQWNMQLICHLLDHELDPAAAVAAPRFTVFPGSDAADLSRPRELRCESRLGSRVLGQLRARGHKVRVIGPWAAGGSAQVVSVAAGTGCLAGAADPRMDGVTLGV